MTIISLLFHRIRFAPYYFHERFGERISWGKLKHPRADLPIKGILTPADMEAVREKLRTLGCIE